MSFMNINGEILSAGNNKYSSWLFLPTEEPDRFDWGNWTYQELIDNVYEPLRAKYPNYITRSVIGRDASNTYDIWQYTFDPQYSEQTLYLQSGVHPYEEDSWIALARVMQIICEDWDKHEGIAYLRWSCKIVVVPVVNVWGVSQARGSRTLSNVNGVNLNRDTTSLTEAESVAVTNFILTENSKRKISGAIDCHTTVNNSYGDYMLCVDDGAINSRMSKNIGMMLVQKNLLDRTQDYLDKWELGAYDTRLPYFGPFDADTYERFFYRNNIPAITCEHSDYVWDTRESTGKAVAKAIECQMNHLLGFARAKYFTEEH